MWYNKVNKNEGENVMIFFKYAIGFFVSTVLILFLIHAMWSDLWYRWDNTNARKFYWKLKSLVNPIFLQHNKKVANKYGDCGIIDPVTQEAQFKLLDPEDINFTEMTAMKFVMKHHECVRRVVHRFQYCEFYSDSILILPTGIYVITTLENTHYVYNESDCWQDTKTQCHEWNPITSYRCVEGLLNHLVNVQIHENVPTKHIIVVGNKKMKSMIGEHLNSQEICVTRKELSSYLETCLDGEICLDGNKIKAIYKGFDIQSRFFKDNNPEVASRKCFIILKRKREGYEYIKDVIL